MEINIAQVCGEDMISRSAGEKVRELMLKHWDDPTLSLDFGDRLIGSVSFFDEAIGLLTKKGGKKPEEILKKLHFVGLKKEDRDLLNYVFASRVKEWEGNSRKK